MPRLARLNALGDWSAWLAEGDKPEHLTVIRRNIDKSLPCGCERFLRMLEKTVGFAAIQIARETEG